MTGGIFYKQSFPKNTKILIEVAPSKGTKDCKMGIYTAKKNSITRKYHADDYIANVSSTSSSATTFTTSSKIDGIYFRNWAGNRWTGTFTISW